MDPAMEGTSATVAEYTEIEGTSAAKDPLMDEISAAEYMEIEGTSAAKDPPMDEISLLMDWLVKLKETSNTQSTENGERTYWPKNSIFRVPEHIRSTEIEGTSAAKDPLMDEISAAEYMEIEGTSAAKDPSMDEISATEHKRPISLLKWTHQWMRLKGHQLEETSNTQSTENGERTYWPKNSIFRVPEHIRSSRESNFEPKLVSIGPYYHGRNNLKRMQGLKIRCKEEILKMLGTAVRGKADMPSYYMSMYAMSAPSVRRPTQQEEMGIDTDFLQQFMVSAWKARAYYKEEFYHEDDEFVKMLFLDSCFIIRTIFAFSQQTQSMSFLDVHIKEVRSDLLLLDNQIPLFFIKEVYEWFLTNLNDKILPDFNTVLEPFICLDMPWRINHDAKSSEAAHLLDLYWRYSLSPKMDMERTSSERYRSETERDLSAKREYHSNSSEINLSNNTPMMIANATELQQMAGIEFEKFKDEGHLDVIFSNGIMRMPRLKIDSGQITLLRNLIAFENCIIPSMRTISCYMKLMDALIDSANDVMLLQKYGVIYNTLESHERAATFFNDIGNFCFTDDNENPFSGLYKDVQKYYDSRWHRRWASLRHNYFSSPWAGISVVAAVTLLILSALQTFYTVYGVYKLNN